MNTATIVEETTISMKDMMEAFEMVNAIPKPDQWFLIDPFGNAYQGTVEQLTPVLLKEHPLMKWTPPEDQP